MSPTISTGGPRYPGFAIARTFSAGDFDLLPESFDAWRHFPPCSTNSSVKVDLFLVYSQDLDESIQAQSAIHASQEIFESGEEWSSCISGVFGFGVDIDASEDLYLSNQQDTNVLWVNGPNRQFERTIRAMQSGQYELMFLMEMDTIPIQELWLDMIMEEIYFATSEFVVLGSKYRGDKWDTFLDVMPSSLVNHINGNAIYNLTHPLFHQIIVQLEHEAGTIANSVPFDYRIRQIIEEAQSGIAPTFHEEHRLPNILVSAMRQFNLDSLFRETPLIGNYASTNVMLSSLTGNEVVIHGATLFVSWDQSDLGDVSLVVSDWDPPQAQPMLASLEKANHPFTMAIVLGPGRSRFEVRHPVIIPILFSSRHGQLDSADMCTVDVRTPWFVMSNSLFQLKVEAQIMVHSGNNGFKPLISFEEPQFESCYAYATCARDIGIAQSISTGFNKIFQDFDFVFHTQSRNKYCQFLRDNPNRDWKNFPSATSFVAYLDKTNVLHELYALSDRRKYGSHFISLRT